MSGSARALALTATGFLALAACAQLPNQVDVGVGTAGYVGKEASLYAALYKPYAQMSALAYLDPPALTSDERRCPDAKKLRDPKIVDASHTAEDNLALAGWLEDLTRGGWTCIRSHSGAIGCPPNVPCAGGLFAMAWRRKDCSEVVIAFRGTVAGDRGDWESNLRWFADHKVFDQIRPGAHGDQNRDRPVRARELQAQAHRHYRPFARWRACAAGCFRRASHRLRLCVRFIAGGRFPRRR
jgi:hypothetical protein